MVVRVVVVAGRESADVGMGVGCGGKRECR